MDWLNTQTIVQAGSVVVALALIFYLVSKLKIENKQSERNAAKDADMMKLMGNHMTHANDSNLKLANSVDKLGDKVERLDNNQVNIVGALDRNARVFGKLEDKIDKI